MSFSDSVTNYYLEDQNKVPISFSKLPLGNPNGSTIKKSIFLVDNGMQKIYKQVVAWNFDISGEEAKILVLSKDKRWIRLVKPEKSFQETVRSVLVTVNCLHFVKNHPRTAAKTVWNQLGKMFSLYEVRPCENDLMDHLPLIQAMVKKDNTILKSKFVVTFLENLVKREVFNEVAHTGLDARSKVTVSSDEDEESELFDTVCAICDNGGEILNCKGGCLRSFHATVDAGKENACVSLGLSEAQVKALKNFVCWNCQHKMHQCLACGKLGSSDESADAKVFRCDSASCGYFYHKKCVAESFCPTDEAEEAKLLRRIIEAESFTCRIHKCFSCGQGEDKDTRALQFAVCRRCPKAYHRKCLPRNITFEDVEGENIVTRAWDHLLPNGRILIYCWKHKIDEKLGTPIMNHINFLNLDEKGKSQALDLRKKRKSRMDKISMHTDDDDYSSQKTVSKVQKYALADDVKQSASSVKTVNSFSKKELDSSEKLKEPDTMGKPPRSGCIKCEGSHSSLVAKTKKRKKKKLNIQFLCQCFCHFAS